jgi:lysophospholipase L1-like esterase
MSSRLTIQELIQKDYDRKVKTFLSLPLEGKDIMVGDSMIAYLNLSKYLFQDWINQGIAGDTTNGVLNRLDAVMRLKPKRIVLSIGSNDLVLTDNTYEMTMKNMQTIIQTLKHDAQVYVCLITPVNPIMKEANQGYIAGRTNEAIQTLNDGIKHTFQERVIDVYTPLVDHHGLLDEKYSKDGIHLNDEGYKQFVKSIRYALNITT